MLYEIKGICSECAEKYVRILNDPFVEGLCSSCGESPFKIKKFKGVIYVAKNPFQRGLKVGLTTKDVVKRMKDLGKATGVRAIVISGV